MKTNRVLFIQNNYDNVTKQLQQRRQEDIISIDEPNINKRKSELL